MGNPTFFFNFYNVRAMRYIKRVVIETTGVCDVTLRLLRYTLIGVCTDTNVIYQSVLEKRPIGHMYRKDVTSWCNVT